MKRALILLAVLASPAFAQEPVVTLRATVTGNQEQPRVMYILPWQPPESGEFEYAPSRALADDLFRGVDREEFIRELNYREALGRATNSTDTIKNNGEN